MYHNIWNVGLHCMDCDSCWNICRKTSLLKTGTFWRINQNKLLSMFFFLYSDAGTMVPYQIALRNFATVRGINIYSLRCSDQILKISDGLVFCVFHIVTTTCAWKATHFCIYIKYLNNSNKPLIHFYVLQNDRWRQHKRIIYCQLSYFTFACFSPSYSMTLAIPEKKKEIIFL